MGQNSIRKKILLRGVTSSPDDYLCPDGDLACAMGVENTDGGMRESGKHGPEVVLDMKGRDFRVVFEHKVKPENNWIVWTGSSNRVLLWLKDGADFGGNITPENSLKCGSKSLPKVEAIGNTLIIVCENDEGEFETHYVLWNVKGQKYNYLGMHIPELEMQFGLRISHRTLCDWEEDYYADNYTTPAPFKVEGLKKSILTTDGEINSENSQILTDHIYGKLRQAIYDLQKDGYFAQPFLVRYALKLYDGSYTMHSSPIFMPITTMDKNGASPYCIIAEYKEEEIRYFIDMVVGSLHYKANGSSINNLKDWKEIVKGVDIFVSAPLYTYDESKKITRIYGASGDIPGEDTVSAIMKQHSAVGSYMPWYVNLNDTYSEINKMKDWKENGNPITVDEDENPFKLWDNDTLSLTNGTYKKYARCGITDLAPGDWDAQYSKFDYTTFWFRDYIQTTPTVYRKRTKNYAFDIGYKNPKDYADEVKNCANFYKLATIDLDDLNGDSTMKAIEIDDSFLNTLVAKPVMDDEYQSHETIIARNMYAYNSRINFAGVSRKLYDDFSLKAMVPYVSLNTDEPSDTNEGNVKYQMCVEVRTENVISYVHSKKEEMNVTQPWPYLYYPQTGVVDMTIRTEKSGFVSWSKSFKAEDHQGLNGSVFFNGMLNEYKTLRLIRGNYEKQWTERKTLHEKSNTVVDVPSKLYTSEAGNPWIYQPTNINTIGNGRVLGMAAVTTALSQGQHGAFPMYVFTTEGIYSLSVNSTGGWVTSQTVTRDVMREGTQLLQIDNAIVFVSDQGLMLLQGDKTVLVSEEQCEEQTVKIKKLPGLNVLLKDTTVITDIANVLGSSPTDDELDEMLTGSLNDYLRGGRVDLYYDYTNQRVIVGREDKKYAWVLALKKNTWTTQPWQLLNSVKSYPDCYAMYKALTGTYYLVKLNTNLSNADKEDAVTLGLPEGMLIVTRPIKLGEAADMLKELENLTVEGLFDKTKMGVAVWGTRNYRDWHLVGSCRGFHIVRKHGSGYRAFVVALMGRLRRGEWLDSITMQVQPRYVQKMHGMGYAGDAST